MISSIKLVEIVLEFRKGCLDKFPNDIDLIGSEIRRERLNYNFYSDISGYLFSSKESHPINCLTRLLKTIRILKTVLRRTMHTWEALHGEIDFDDLLIANTIRYSAPEAFDFIIDNISQIRSLYYQGAIDKRDKNRESLLIKWNDLGKKVSWDTSAAEILIEFLFPCWNRNIDYDPQTIPQGIRHSKPTDYWTRLNFEDLNNEIGDQDIIRAIKAWKENDLSNHIDGLSLPRALYNNPSISPKLEQFGDFLLNGKEIRSLASSLFKIMVEEQGVKANRNELEAFVGLWRLAIRNPIDQQEHFVWIKNEISNVLEKSFRFANDLYYFWRTNNRWEIEERKSNIRNTNTILLRRSIIETARNLFHNFPQKLINSLDPDYPYVIYTFAIIYGSPREGGEEFNSENWAWLTKLLISSARISPSIIIPQIIALIIKQELGNEKYIYTFDKNLAKKIFLDQLDQVIDLISKPFPYDRFNEQVRDMIDYARKIAVDYQYVRAVDLSIGEGEQYYIIHLVNEPSIFTVKTDSM